MAEKSPDAFRTISEVSEWLDTPAYVLRFWESRFAQIKPVKRTGGRRYYRPEDMLLLGGIKRLRHFDDQTISAVQAVLRKKGVKHVMALSPELDKPARSPDSVDEAETFATPVAAQQEETMTQDRDKAPLDGGKKDTGADETLPESICIASVPLKPRAIGKYSDRERAEIGVFYRRLADIRDRMQYAG
ncbi:MAG: MerR family transcriptional regulator [Rhodobacteraceae bacterium]|nr:MerR family transcriptional regulator [Paracoccaceae bacterium]